MGYLFPDTGTSQQTKKSKRLGQVSLWLSPGVSSNNAKAQHRRVSVATIALSTYYLPRLSTDGSLQPFSLTSVVRLLTKAQYRWVSAAMRQGSVPTGLCSQYSSQHILFIPLLTKLSVYTGKRKRLGQVSLWFSPGVSSCVGRLESGASCFFALGAASRL